MSTGTPPLSINNTLFISSLLSRFIRKKKYFPGNMGTYKIGGAPSLGIMPKGSSAGGDPSKYT
jgi:hypothetical protein